MVAEQLKDTENVPYDVPGRFGWSINGTANIEEFKCEQYLMRGWHKQRGLEIGDAKTYNRRFQKSLTREIAISAHALIGLSYCDHLRELKVEKKRRLANKLMVALRRLTRVGLPINSFDELNLTVASAYSRPLSKEFFLAVKRGDTAGIESLLTTDKFLLHSVDYNGKNCVHIAIRVGDLSMLKFLVSKKADIWAVDKFSQTALHHALSNDYSEI
jgi:ankyrin repeat protein